MTNAAAFFFLNSAEGTDSRCMFVARFLLVIYELRMIHLFMNRFLIVHGSWLDGSWPRGVGRPGRGPSQHRWPAIYGHIIYHIMAIDIAYYRHILQYCCKVLPIDELTNPFPRHCKALTSKDTLCRIAPSNSLMS